MAGKNGSGVHEHRRHVQSSRRHQHAGQRLIAAGEGDHAVEPFRFDNRLDRVRDDLATDQREVHALMPHRDAVRDRDGSEFQWVATGGVDAVLG